ncbi:Uncharacterized protein BT3327 [hydrothermal vent metagenome]|uniref:Uncharacterized protein BT3327 n=1 Tax=hydrothermal vent metagenome TaxID=652676 RepID=A0A3B0VGJ9_9ZZZZ
MDLWELQQRIAKWENLHTEFKSWPLRPNGLAAALVAFANTDGGQLIFGVDDKEHSIIGLEDIDTVTRQVDNVAYNNCEPPLTVIQETVSDANGDTVVIVNVPKGDQRPYRTTSGIYYIRTSSGRRQASRQELLRLFQSAESLYFDETPMTRASLADLNTQEITTFFQNAYPSVNDLAFERTLVNVKLAQEINGKIQPTFAGVLFFASQPQKFVPYAYLTALRIPGTQLETAPSDQKRIEGSIFTILDEILRFLYIHLPVPHQISGLEPESKFEFPDVVLRELLVNAVAHRDYTIQGPIRILIFDDRVEIRSPGQLPNTITLDSLKLGVHVLRNPTIYNVLLRIGLVTDAGSGIPRVIKKLIEDTGTEPDLKMEGNEFVVTLYRSTFQD